MEIPQVVSFSGGRTSAFMTLEVLKIHPSAEVIFMDTGAEHPKTYEFIRNFAKHFGVNITCLRVIPNRQMRKASGYEQLGIWEIGPDLEPWRRMLRKYGNPYVGGAFCTDRMKTVPFTKYCDEKYGKGNYERWLGIRIDEPNRLGNRGPGFHYLADISEFEKQDVLEWWEEQPFDLGIREHLGNCVFCIKKSLPKVALAMKDEPELANDFYSMLYESMWEYKRTKKFYPEKRDRYYGVNISHEFTITHKQPVMFRGKNTMRSIIAIFDSTGRDELASRMTSMRQYDTGSCSESCEAFSCQLGFNFEDAA